MAVNALVAPATALSVLRLQMPFSQMNDADLAYLVEHAQRVSFAAGADILLPAQGVVRQLYIVLSGRVLAQQVGVDSGFENSRLTHGQGDFFPIGALLANRATTNRYTALEDSTCWVLPEHAFLHLMHESPVFHLFCTQYLSSLVTQSRAQIQHVFAQRGAEQQALSRPLKALIRRVPISVLAQTPLAVALERMQQERIGCMMVVDAEKRPIGVLTQSDVIGRVLLPGVPLETPIGTVMSPAPHTLSMEASAYEAALEMASRAIRHLPVVDTNGVLAGVVSERDLFALQRTSLTQIRASITTANTLSALQQAAQDIRELALNLLAQGVSAEQLTHFVSLLNDALTTRIIVLMQEKHGLTELDFAWLAFGSEGRHEQTLSTDQDNGVIFVVPEGFEEAVFKPRILAWAQAINETLAQCGFPLCEGLIMASNPDLCLTLPQWQRQFQAWVRSPNPQALLNATIFFDFRVLYGNAQLGRQLRETLNETARGNDAFFRMMAANALNVAPPLGLLRDFQVEADGQIDLKKSGSRLFVDAARIFALRIESAESNTAQRLREAAQHRGGSVHNVDSIIDAFHFIQLLRLRTQHAATQANTAGGNRIAPSSLPELDRRILKEAFRQARKLQLRLKLDYQL